MCTHLGQVCNVKDRSLLFFCTYRSSNFLYFPFYVFCSSVFKIYIYIYIIHHLKYSNLRKGGCLTSWWRVNFLMQFHRCLTGSQIFGNSNSSSMKSMPYLLNLILSFDMSIDWPIIWQTLLPSMRMKRVLLGRLLLCN